MNPKLGKWLFVTALIGAAGCIDGGGGGEAPDATVPPPGPDTGVVDHLTPDARVEVPDPDVPDADPPDAEPSPDATPRCDPPPPTGSRTKYVASTIQVPTNATQTRAFALDIDGDPNDRPDNALGGIFSALSQQALDIQGPIDAAVAAGQLVSLHMLQADNLADATNAAWSVFQGENQQDPDFSGAGSFSIQREAPHDSLLHGRVVGGVFTGGPGKARIKLVVMNVPVILDLIGARISAEVSPTGCSNGKLGGAITQETIVSQVFPALAAGFTASLAADPGCPSACTGTAATLQGLFDTNRDGTITVTEVESTALVRALFAPDVDLLDATGAFNPRQDRVNDSLSLGIGFSCAGASFVAPGKP